MTEMRDRLLRGALGDAASAEPSAACADADALAAWADGTMAATARAAFEAHAAGCARCQALVAAMVRTEPPPVRRPWWQQRVAWVVPLAAMAVALLVVRLSLMERPSSPAAVAQVARVEQAAPAPAPAVAPAAPPVTAAA